MLLIPLSEPHENRMKLLENPSPALETATISAFGVESHFLNQTTVPNVSTTYGRNRPYSYE
jgi:hypothetical protein